MNYTPYYSPYWEFLFELLSSLTHALVLAPTNPPGSARIPLVPIYMLNSQEDLMFP